MTQENEQNLLEHLRLAHKFSFERIQEKNHCSGIR